MSDKSVWVIEQGCYSDYRVVGVFTTEKNAKTVADAINAAEHYGDEATISEWPLNPAVDNLRKGYELFSVVMVEDGTVERCDRQEFSGYEIAGKVWMWRRTKAPAYVGKGIPDALNATVWAKDKKHAVKVANEHRLRLIAIGEWHSDKPE